MSVIAVVVSNSCTSDARVIKMINAAVAGGHEVHVFATLAAGIPAYQKELGVTYRRLEWKPAEWLLKNYILLRLISKVIPRFILMWILKPLVNYTKYKAFAEIYGPAISSVNPKIIHAHDLICLPAALVASESCGAKVVYDAHELEVHRNPPLPFFRKLWVGFIEKKYAQKAAAVITVGRKVREVLAEHIHRSDIHVIYNAPIRNRCISSVRKDLMLPDESPLIIYVGKVTQGRGVGDIVSMLPKIPGVFFAAVGPADLKTVTALLKQASRLEVSDRFRILPPVPHDQVVSYIEGANLGVISVEPITLSYRYCMPNKLFELAFASVPILSNELDEIHEFLGELGIGAVFDFEKTYQLPSEIQRLIANSKSFRPSQRSREILESVYSWDAQIIKLNEIYKSLA